MLISLGLASEFTSFVVMRGGRTNRLWRFNNGSDTLVCKLFANASTPLFPNDARSEAKVLKHLTGTGLSPDFLAHNTCASGNWLVYRHVPGASGTADAAAVGNLLRRLHSVQPPSGLRRLHPGEILAQGDAMINLRSTEGRRLMELRPEPTEPVTDNPVFLHGDVVAQNIIATPTGLRLIDWQCPAVGDATEDLAVFLSPAMQYVYGGRSVSQAEEAAMLAAYGHGGRRQRYFILAPAYHWRMAAYCLWRAQRGDPDYHEAHLREVARLKAINKPTSGNGKRGANSHPDH